MYQPCFTLYINILWIEEFTLLFLSLTIVSAAGCATDPKYKDACSFSEGLAPVQAQNGRWVTLIKKMPL